MAFTLLPPILIVAGLIVGLVVLIRRMPEVASLAGKDLAKAQADLKHRQENPTRARRVLNVLKQIGVGIWQRTKTAYRFVMEKGLKKAASSKAITGFITRLFAKLHRTRTQATPPASDASASPKTPISIQPSLDPRPSAQQARQAVLEEQKEHEAAMELSRMNKEAQHELLMNNLPAAEKLYLAMIKREKNSKEAFRGLADVYEKQGNYNDMEAILEHLLQLDKHDVEAKKKLEQLKKAETA